MLDPDDVLTAAAPDDEPEVTTLFQPIVDVMTFVPVGFECLSRVGSLGDDISGRFARARAEGSVWRLDRACRRAALRRIAELDARFASARYFINVAPDSFADPRLQPELVAVEHDFPGLRRERLVLEITEDVGVDDHDDLERLVRSWVEAGFSVALDDFGAGHSGLLRLVSCTPQWLKLDRALVRDLHRLPYKQALVRSLVGFAQTVDARLVAEGVELAEDFDTLVRLGVSYAQGWLLARPALEPADLAEEVEHVLRPMGRRHPGIRVELDDTIAPLVARRQTIARDVVSCEQIERLFRKDPALDHLIVVDGDRPFGLLTRQHFYLRTGGPFGYSLFQKRPLDLLAKRAPMTVRDDLSITALARLAMERLPEDLYDPVVVVDAGDHLLGTVTMKQLLGRAVELEVESAKGQSPLTHLPGNRMIQKWIHEALGTPPFTVIYADLDRFKEYNDTHGFYMGDEMIRLAARVLARHLPSMGEEARLGHIGGDDLIIVGHSMLTGAVLEAICSDFDREKLALFHPEDLERGWFEAHDRRGERGRVALVTMSLSVIDSDRLVPGLHPAALSQIAGSLKSKVKQITALERRSNYLFERRHSVLEATELGG